MSAKKNKKENNIKSTTIYLIILLALFSLSLSILVFGSDRIFSIKPRAALVGTTIPMQPGTPQSNALDSIKFGIDEVREFTFDPVYGEVGNLYLESKSKMDRTLYRWKDIESVRNIYTWAALDKIVKTYNEKGIVLVIDLHELPIWACEKSGSTLGPLDEEDLGEFEQFSYDLAERYDGDGVADVPGNYKLTIFEPLNEADNYASYGGSSDKNKNKKPDYQDYAYLQKAFFNGIKGANQSAVVLTSGFAWEETSAFDYNFVNNYLNFASITWNTQHFDYFNLHYYENYANFWKNKTGKKEGIVAKIAEANRILSLNNGRGKRIMMTEIGYANPTPNATWEVTQAETMLKMYAAALSANSGPYLWFCLKDYDSDGVNYNYGLVNKNNGKKQAFNLYKIMVQELGNLTYYRKESTYNWNMYHFSDYSNRKNHKAVAWADSGSVNKSLYTREVKVFHSNSTVTTIQDGSNGDADGRINSRVSVNITTSPVIFQWLEP